jgi:hypothetical protein
MMPFLLTLTPSSLLDRLVFIAALQLSSCAGTCPAPRASAIAFDFFNRHRLQATWRFDISLTVDDTIEGRELRVLAQSQVLDYLREGKWLYRIDESRRRRPFLLPSA